MRGAFFGIASTAVSGLTNVAIQLLAASLLGPEEFARFSIAATTAILGLGLGRALVAQVDMLRGSATSHVGAGEAALATCLGLGVAGAILTAAGDLTGGPTLTMIGLGACCAAVLVFQDSLRFRSFRLGRPHIALVSDLVVLIAAAAILLPDRADLSASLTVGLWAAATVLGGLIGAVWLRYRPWRVRVGADWLREHRDLVGPGVGEYVLQAGLPYTLNFVILAVGGAGAFAGYRLAQLIFAGLGNLASGLNAVMLPRLVDTRDPRLARRFARWEVAVLTVVTGLLAAVLAVIPPWVGSAIFGENWVAMTPFLVVCAIHGWVNALSIPNYSLIRLLGFAAFSFWIRLGSFAVTFLGAALAAGAGPVAVAWVVAAPALAAWVVRVTRAELTLDRLIRKGEAIA